MVYTKRLILSIILGMIAGLACAYVSKDQLLAKFPAEMVSPMMCGTALNRTIIGLLIGVSAWRMHWALHGIIMGFLGSLPLAAPAGNAIFIIAGAGIVWGFLIELIVTVIFRAPMRTIEPAPAPAPAPIPPPPEPPPPPPPSE